MSTVIFTTWIGGGTSARIHRSSQGWYFWTLGAEVGPLVETVDEANEGLTAKIEANKGDSE